MAFRPIDAANSCISRSRELLVASQLPQVAVVREDIIRSALVMTVGAMDSYMHWLVYQEITEVSKSQAGLPKKLANLDIPFSELASLADAVLEGRREQTDTRPWVQVKNATQRRLLRETFQSYDQVSGAMAMAGISKGWTQTAKHLNTTSDAIKTRLNQIVHRRNQIVHEGDITRASKPRKVKLSLINHADVSADVTWMEKLIGGIEAIR